MRFPLFSRYLEEGLLKEGLQQSPARCYVVSQSGNCAVSAICATIAMPKTGSLGVPNYPAQHKETYATEVNGWRNKIYWGDNLQIMSHLLKEYRGQVRLVYIDPPFDSKADYKRTIQIKGKLATSDQTTFEEKQYTDVWINDEYLQFMYERLILIRELLANDGSLYLHCDWHKSHYLRLILDEVFGMDNFVNEIIWKRRGGVLNQTRQYGVSTDTILFYAKSSDFNSSRDRAIQLATGYHDAVREAAALLCAGTSLVLLCACGEERACHRSYVARLIQDALPVPTEAREVWT